MDKLKKIQFFITVIISIATIVSTAVFIYLGSFPICGGRGAKCFYITSTETPFFFWGAVSISLLLGIYFFYYGFKNFNKRGKAHK
ncbi:MAG: hypothetical protein AB1810_14765 [Pseudomonadota bacterium]